MSSRERGPRADFTPIHVFDLRLQSSQPTELALPDGFTTALAVLRGSVTVQGSDPIGAAEVALFDRSGDALRIDAASYASALLLCGAPLGEPIAGQGPFVMNTRRRSARRCSTTVAAAWATWPEGSAVELARDVAPLDPVVHEAALRRGTQ